MMPETFRPTNTTVDISPPCSKVAKQCVLGDLDKRKSMDSSS